MSTLTEPGVRIGVVLEPTATIATLFTALSSALLPPSCPPVVTQSTLLASIPLKLSAPVQRTPWGEVR